jgi:methoxymalonate biosynthesis acyl carrier protein
MDVRTRIKRYFSKAIAAEIGDEDNIFELGVVNSLFAMQLVLFVEHEFSLTVEREDLDIKNFCSIAALTNFVLNKLAARTADREFGHGHPAD